MKKLFFLSGLILMVSMLFAQTQEQIKDGGFETNWSELTAPRGKYWDFNAKNVNHLFRTLNSLYEIEIMPQFTTKLTSFKETDNPYDGSSALRMETVAFADNLTVPGVFGTISYYFIEEFLETGSIEVLADFESRPKRLTGYYKYESVRGDSASIEIELTNWGEVIGRALWKEKETKLEWEKFDIPINYVNDYASVTHLQLIFSASAEYNFNDLMNCKGQPGSKFWIDNIAFEYNNVGLREPLMDRTISKAHPNPATTSVTISFDKALEGKLVIYNVLGAEVATQAVSGNTSEANISHLAAGTYFYRIIDGNTIRTSGKFIVE